MSSAKMILTIAESQLGVHEQPMGSNRGPQIQVYQEATFLHGSGWPWCIAFIQWTFAKAGIPFPYRSAGAYDFYAWAQRAGWTTPSPKPGDVAIFNIGTGHGAILTKVTAHTVETIDGNVGNRVCRNTRPRNLCRGFIHRQGITFAAGVAVPKAPLYQVVTSSSGHSQVVFGGPLPQVVSYVANKGVGLVRAGKAVLIRRKP